MTGDGNTLWIWQWYAPDDSWHLIPDPDDQHPMITRSEAAGIDIFGAKADEFRRNSHRPIRLARFEEVTKLRADQENAAGDG